MSTAAKWGAGFVLCVFTAFAGCAHTEGHQPEGNGAEKMRPPDAGPLENDASTPQKPPERERRLPGEEVLSQQPVVPELSAFDAPVPEVKTLSNGLKVYLVERPESTLQAVRLVVKRGASSDPVKLPGLASMTAEMLEAGSGGKTQAQMAAAADAIGATLAVGAGQDFTMMSISALKTQLPAMTGLLAQVALRPNFAAADWKKLQAQRTAELIAARARPEVGAELAFRAAVYGNHPLGRPGSGTPESVKAMTLAQVKGFFQSFSPQQAALVAVGGASSAEVLAELERTFGKWKARGATPAPAAAAVPTEAPRLVVVDFPGKPQTVLRMGHPAVPRSSPDYLSLEVLNTLLGGSFTSRLNANLREKNGYSYGAGSYFSYGVGPGPFMVSSNVKTEVTGPALREALREVRGVVEQALTQQELEKGKALLAADLVRELETSGQAAGAISEIFLYDLPLDEYRTFVSRLKALTVEEVNAAARRVLKPEQLTITLAGDLAKVEPQLKAEPSLQSLPPGQRRTSAGTLVQ